MSPDQSAIVNIFAILETFFEEAGEPLTAAQSAALRSAEADVLGGVS